MSMRLFFCALLAGCAGESKPPPKIEMIHLDPPSDPSATPTANEDAGHDPHNVALVVGALATFPAESVKNFSAANENIDVRITPDGKTFVVAGKKKGRCDLLLVHRNGTQEIFTFEVLER